ncbi:MAG: F0F1 ATP synthase subunit delta [Oscillospiraceae bacterium]|nr:F0F1 ATP synthase subunit delta [Oscillospiraceae bacterium]
MRNILKGFLNPKAKDYIFPDTDSIIMEEPSAEPEPTEASDDDSFSIPAQWGGEDNPPQSYEDSNDAAFDAPDEEDNPAAAPPAAGGSPVQYAQLQAELILKQAREEADQLIEAAQAEAEKELESIRAGARDEGYRTGYAEGTAKAMEDAAREREAQAQRLEEDVKVFLEKASIARDEMLSQTQDELLDLCIAVAEKVVRVSLRSSSEVIVRMIQTATERMKRQEWVHIYIPGCDARGVTQISPALTTTLAGLSQHIKVVPMGDEEDGTCIIETPEEIVDASVSTQMSTIRDLLREQLGAQMWPPQ